jgi:hypothetical protein
MGFDIDNSIERWKNESYLNLLQILDKENQLLDQLIARAKKLKSPDKYELVDYKRDIKYFWLYLEGGIIAKPYRKDEMVKFLPIIKALVEKGELNASALEILQ